jgi:hypothetical protein
LAAAAASEGEAQVLSGTLRRSPDASAAAGVLVLAEQVGERRIVARTITSATGEYRLLLGEARVVVRALRVGFAPVTLDTVQLAPGEHRILDAVLEAIPADLRAARIVADSRCSAPADAVDVVGQLLQQARTALLATNQAVSGETFVTHAEVDRHSGTALLTQRVLETSGVGAFRGHGVDTILRAGFLTERRDGSLEYRAPDTDVLLNDAFLADRASSVCTFDRLVVGAAAWKSKERCGSMRVEPRSGSSSSRTSGQTRSWRPQAPAADWCSPNSTTASGSCMRGSCGCPAYAR